MLPMKQIFSDWMARRRPPKVRPVPDDGIEREGTDLNIRYDLQTAEVLERVLQPGSNCVDVGCHEGKFLDDMRRLSPKGLHYAFEPLPHMHAALAMKYAGTTNVNLQAAALSNGSGTTTFQHVVTNPGYSGVLRRLYDRPDEEVVEITVRRAKLDDCLPRFKRIRLIKIDVEGGELQVLEGARRTLRRWRPFVVFEHGKRAAGCYGTQPGQVHDLLTSCGLRISLLGDWLRSDGAITLSRDAFIDQYEREKNYYFFAHR